MLLLSLLGVDLALVALEARGDEVVQVGDRGDEGGGQGLGQRVALGRKDTSERVCELGLVGDEARGSLLLDLKSDGQEAVNHHVGVATNGGGEVRVAVEIECIVTPVLGRVELAAAEVLGLLHGARRQVFDDGLDGHAIVHLPSEADE